MSHNLLFRRMSKLWAAASTGPAMVYRLGRKRLGLSSSPELYYVVPAANWVTDWVGSYITSGITHQFGWRAHVTSTPHLLVDHIVHYGELGAFLSSLGTRRNHSNTIITTVFHGSRTEKFPDLAKGVEKLIDNLHTPTRIVTACRIMEKRLVSWGASPEQVVCIPLGVDLSLFKPVSTQQRMELRHKIGIPDDAFCIGSFQKDGNGWGEGLTPKLIKGPDIFLQVIKRLHKRYNLFVFLTAPARGYVKQGLDSMGIPYRHEILTDYQDVAKLYHCLDLYLVASREEGGPKAIPEALASGVPLVSTRVGLAPDVIQHGKDGFLANAEDVTALAEYVSQLIEQPELRRRFVENGLNTIVDYDWQRIAAKYYQDLYRPLLNALS